LLADQDVEDLQHFQPEYHLETSCGLRAARACSYVGTVMWNAQ
jgi:hypothetical protein